MKTNLIKAYLTLANCPIYIKELVEYIDLCTNPIVDGVPHQQDYLDVVWGTEDDRNPGQSMRMIMEQVIVAADIYDLCLLTNVLGFLGMMINTHLDNDLSFIAEHLGFSRVQNHF